MEDSTKLDSSGNENKTAIKGNTTGGPLKGDFIAGTVLASRYRIIGIVGKGGMGEVYKAEDLQLSQVVALKFLPESVVGDERCSRVFAAKFAMPGRFRMSMSAASSTLASSTGGIFCRWSLLMEMICRSC